MNHETNNKRMQASDEELEQAIASFRQSVKNWSKQEHAAARAAGLAAQSRGRGWGWFGSGFGSWLWMSAGAVAAACAVAVVIVAGHGSGPVQQARAVRLAPAQPDQARSGQAQSGQAQTAEQVKPESALAQTNAQTDAQTTTLAEALTERTARRAAAMQAGDESDEALLAAVDNDISQGTAKALAPMADWMGDSANR